MVKTKQDTIEGCIAPDVFQFTAELISKDWDFKSEANTLKFIRFYCDDKLFLKKGFYLRVQHSLNAEYKDFVVQKSTHQYQDTVVDFKIENPVDIRLCRFFVGTAGLQSNLHFKFFLDNSKV